MTMLGVAVPGVLQSMLTLACVHSREKTPGALSTQLAAVSTGSPKPASKIAGHAGTPQPQPQPLHTTPITPYGPRARRNSATLSSSVVWL